MGIKIKSAADIDMMREGGMKLAAIKKRLVKEVSAGVNAFDIDKLAENLVKKGGGVPSFKTVRDYRWTTCVNINEGVVHGIPKKTLVFADGDLVSVDVGFYYKGFHTDTSFSLVVGNDQEKNKMLEVGKEALASAINKTHAGNRVYDISQAIEKRLLTGNYSPIRALVGHGVGVDLHEDPQIPCFTTGKKADSPELPVGAVLAIEVMYAKGGPDVVLEEDGWTISTADGKISALFEETVAVTKNGPVVLTDN